MLEEPHIHSDPGKDPDINPLPPAGPTTNTFLGLGLKPELLSVLDRVGYSSPTPIQGAFIPQALSGRDVIGQAQTGTGKTAAFLLPFLHSWTEQEVGSPRALVLVPTRELAVQVTEEAHRLTPDPDACRTISVYGGQRMRQQLAGLKRGCTIVVGTPGRVLDHLARGTLKLDQIRYVVLDEADRMLDIGFRPDIERILRRCPSGRQTMLLSATMPPPVLRLTERYMLEPIHLNLAPETVTVDKIRQSYITVDEARKFDLLMHLLERDQPRQCIIFCERKRWAEDVYRHLRLEVKRAACMHGDLPQPLRNRIMQGFREGKIRYLVATDVVGRGIDVKNISHVINYDIPEDPENYVHRIGRTGRIGADGIAILFVQPEQGQQLTNIEIFINKMIPEEKIASLRTVAPPRARPTTATPTAPTATEGTTTPETETPASAEQQPPQQQQDQSKPVFGRRVKKYSNRP